MKILGIDTSSEVATVAIMDDDKLIGEYTINHKKTHSQKLMPMIDEMFKSCEITPNDIDLIGVCIGPGSFTGLRIGVATAKAIAHARNIHIAVVNSLESLAFNMNLSKGIICPIIDAQRNQVYTCKYSWENNTLVSIDNISVKNIDELIDEIKERYEEVVLLGEAVDLHKDKLNDLDNIYIAPNSHKLARASSVCELAFEKYKKGDVKNHYDVVPYYIRKSQAEVQYEEKLKRMGENGK
ncbi:tRNA (adenosine(37)-N6)-threonylcarbamoyltransferase complex dimerization subunit type 1 TsaB [Tepidibacter formicigenes]|jgi:tRNA threonylcarbamoyladenosine biosynthesis protein TsaB|uniref:tRNA threonylcarbamoyladenosine biosynthesis protein TsaB n=1 Tax=Tepidibacter formicigenes DSM 15518 TaxID=1123349 RepID=A0A1M6U066_9FIRM|nr:tRNA (adenosine(37)-N6)-threonylcarbamoyltransferase complex dimerization subunit type 1 TsaB [Tepidibacter formicigenes]SHK62551.1 tRNA threonylcarbamoyladenosine biosynthesis protein TsaB [Tepidibacter formicigenes DSM 15518]